MLVALDSVTALQAELGLFLAQGLEPVRRFNAQSHMYMISVLAFSSL